MFDHDTRGLSLIETLVVMVIISVVATMVVLTLSVRSSDLGPRSQLQQVAIAIDGVCERALFQAQAQTMEVHATGLGWWHQSGLPAQPPELKPLISWPKDWQVSLIVEGMRVPILDNLPTDPSRAQLICGAMGERSAFNLMLSNAEEQGELQMPSTSRLGQWTIAVE